MGFSLEPLAIVIIFAAVAAVVANRVGDNTTTLQSPNGGPPGSGPWKVACGNRATQLNECLLQLPEILRKADYVGIPSSKKDLDASCKAFKTGMGCVEEYARICLSPKDRRLLEEQVAGANYTFRFLCDDKVFQEEYLQYTSCYRGISSEWDSCANKFMQLVGEEMARKNVSEQSRTLELCCAKYGFLRCVYMASRLICRKEEAFFLNRIAETLSSFRVYSLVCRDLETLCSGGGVRPRGPDRIYLAGLVVAAILLWRRDAHIC